MSVSGEHQCSVLHRGGDAIDKGVTMYRIRLGCAVYAQMNISPDQARRMMYKGGNYYDEGNETQDDVQDDGINDGRGA